MSFVDQGCPTCGQWGIHVCRPPQPQVQWLPSDWKPEALKLADRLVTLLEKIVEAKL